MEEKQIFEKVIQLVEPFAKNKETLKVATETSSFLKDLQVSSSRLVDVILAMEDTFDIEVADEEADKVDTLGDAVSLIRSKIQ